jgi:hypothetical protein
MTVRVVVCVAALVAALAIAPPAMAGDAASQSPANGDQINTNPDEFLPKDAFGAGQPNDADADAVTDQEATRTDINRRSGPTVTLGVSGWVNQQIMRTR